MKVHKKECKHGNVDKLLQLVLNVIVVNVNSPDFIFTSTLHHIHTEEHRTIIKKVNQVWPLTQKQKNSVSDSSESATRHTDWTGKQKPTFGTTVGTEKLKEHSLCQPKAQST